MNGFDKEPILSGCGRRSPRCPNKHPPYSYVPHSETKPYFDMAKQYVLADEMYGSNFDSSSFVSHQYIIAGQAQSSVDYPFGQWGCPGGPGDKIDIVGSATPDIPTDKNSRAGTRRRWATSSTTPGVSWGYYTGQIGGNGAIWSAYQAIKHIYNGPDWKQRRLLARDRFLRRCVAAASCAT